MWFHRNQGGKKITKKRIIKCILMDINFTSIKKNLRHLLVIHFGLDYFASNDSLTQLVC